MAEIRYENIGKRFGSVVALQQLNLTIHDKEFVTLVGPSGCGKSTTLNITAGLEDPSEGALYIDDRLVNAVPPGDRDIAMVFQSYALYPHKSVRENIGFGLKVRKMPKDEIERRVQEAAVLLGIDNLLERKPRELSGGQRQRVALGRAITRNPKVFLLDEPLSNLDAKLRVQMRAELKLLFERVEGTVLYVTHDQAEAMTLSDRVVVMDHGVVQQVGTPLEVYNTPSNHFVASFLGSPPMNFLKCNAVLEEGALQVTGDNITWRIPISGQEAQARLERSRNRITGPVELGVRPEDLTLTAENGDGLACNILLAEHMGSQNVFYVRAGNHQLVVTTDPDFFLPPHTNARLQINGAKLHLFDAQSGANLTL